MYLYNRTAFMMGLGLAVGFLVVLALMFSPLFGGTNAFHASDALFNSIAKGSTYYIPQVLEESMAFEEQSFSAVILRDHPEIRGAASTILSVNGLVVAGDDNGLRVQGDLGHLMAVAVDDADRMFLNEGALVSSRYAMDERQVLFAWWWIMKDMQRELEREKRFAAATFINRGVIKRAIEVGYNFYGIEGQSVVDRWGIILFSLVFYVGYTLWWGYAIFFLFEGLGLELSSGRSREG